jgi:hypothetical protein
VPECGGLVCSGNSCTQCTSDTQCGANAKCCRGACYDGISCCGDGDCRQGERCVDGACQGCRSDRDCGALSCCKDCSGTGRCLAVCEVEQPFTNRSGFDLGTYQGTTSDGSSQPMNSACIAGALCRT